MLRLRQNHPGYKGNHGILILFPQLLRYLISAHSRHLHVQDGQLVCPTVCLQEIGAAAISVTDHICCKFFAGFYILFHLLQKCFIIIHNCYIYHSDLSPY